MKTNLNEVIREQDNFLVKYPSSLIKRYRFLPPY